MINVLLNFLSWAISGFLNNVQFPTFDFSTIWETLNNVIYYPVKILSPFGVRIFFILLNLDWGLTLSLGIIKTVLRFVRGSH